MVLGHKCGAYVADKTVEHPRAHILSVTGGLRYLRHPGGGGGLWKDSPCSSNAQRIPQSCLISASRTGCVVSPR